MPNKPDENWGPWKRHYGGMPVPSGTLVEVNSLAPKERAKDGVRRRIGIAGVDLVCSWGWTPETRDTYPSLPIDYYRIKRPWGLQLLEQILTGIPEPVNA